MKRLSVIGAAVLIGTGLMRGAEPAGPLEIYEVQPGDTLGKIAEATGTSSKMLIELNGIEDPNKLRVGQQLRVTGSTEAKPMDETPVAKLEVPEEATESPAGDPEAPPEEVVETYVIQPGDTLSKVAQQHGVNVAVLLEANPEVDPKMLRVGQKIRVVRVVVQPVGPEAEKQAVADKSEPVESVEGPGKVDEAPKPVPKKPKFRTVRSEGDFVRSLSVPSSRPEGKILVPFDGGSESD